MAKNRKIPFGYMMQNGEITTNPKEVLAVVTIFRSYLNGDSLTTIAQSMEVPYNEGTTWNKNMVKRIIENEKYLGTDKYPQLIDEDTFRKVNAKRIAKATSLCVITDDLQEIRNRTFCKESDDTKDMIESTIAEIENSRFQLEAFDDVLIRKLIECVKVISKTEIIIIFKGGYEVKAEVEKK